MHLMHVYGKKHTKYHINNNMDRTRQQPIKTLTIARSPETMHAYKDMHFDNFALMRFGLSDR